MHDRPWAVVDGRNRDHAHGVRGRARVAHGPHYEIDVELVHVPFWTGYTTSMFRRHALQHERTDRVMSEGRVGLGITSAFAASSIKLG